MYSEINTDSQGYGRVTPLPWSAPRYEDLPPATGAATTEFVSVKLEDVAQIWFAIWATRWKRETSGLSSISQKVAHPSLQRIVELQELALPLILRDLERETSHWFPALKMISGDDPVPANLRGNVPEMRRIWLAWGRAHGHI